jgi:hypothetical protein
MNRLVFTARLRLIRTEDGGKQRPVLNGYRPSWDLGNTWFGEPTLNDGRVLLEDDAELAPGAAGDVQIEPNAMELWGRVRVGACLPMQEGSRVVGYATILGFASRPAWFTPEVAAFVVQARQYCDFIERAAEYPLGRRLATARRQLVALYQAGVALPHAEPQGGTDAGPRPEPPADWPGFEAREAYFEVFDPYVDDPPVAASLSDDLLDVYLDVRRGLALWDRRAPGGAALGEWRFHLDHHWGDHAVDALRALHRACGRLPTDDAWP